MQLTELLYQRVKELGPKGQIALPPGYVAVVSRAAALRPAILAPLFSSPDDQRRLSVDPKSPARVALGFVPSDQVRYRLVREVGGGRQLHKYEPETRKFALLTEDELEIEEFLRVHCGLPPAGSYRFFVVGATELPSQRARAAEGGGSAAEVARLQEELRATREYEEAQDRLFRVQTRLEELGGSARALAEAEQGVASAEADLSRMPWSAQQIADLTARARRTEQDAQRRDAQLEDIERRRARAADSETASLDPFWLSPWFNGGILLGLAVDVAAFLLGHTAIALVALVPYAAALVAVLRFIQADEDRKEMKRQLSGLLEQEQMVRRRFEDEQAPLRAALRDAKVETPADLLAIFEQRAQMAARRDAAVARLEAVRNDAGAGAAAAEIAALWEERARLEQRIAGQGFARSIADVEADLRRAGPARPALHHGAEAARAKEVVSAAANLLARLPDKLLGEAGPRLAQFLSALTDRRIVGAKLDPAGQVLFSAADGRAAALPALPETLRDPAYAALRLCLLERVASAKRLPVIVDDSFAPLDPQKRSTVAKMLKAIAAHTQVIHRIPDALPQGIADHVVEA